jgi:serine protease Do/serine protease DegQ
MMRCGGASWVLQASRPLADRGKVVDRIIQAIWLSVAIAAATCGAAKAGAPVEFGGQNDGSPTLVAILKEILPAVIDIEARGRVAQAATTASKARRKAALPSKVPAHVARRDIIATGSGVVIDAGAGIIVTNNHVIGRAEAITVRLADGRELDAEKVGGDPDTDVAVLKVEAGELTAIQLGDSDNLEVGESVFAIGNPLRLGQTVSSGIVSGLHRSNIGIERYEDFIQTDAAIYPGNSGGALVNLRGRLVGINTAFIGVGKANPGLGFAIPLNMVRAVVDQILEYGEVRRGSLGLTLEDPTASLRRDMKLPARQRGAAVVKVDARSTAEHAGLRSGDVITAFDGVPVQDAAHLRTRMALVQIGEVAELTVLREGRQIVTRAAMAQATPYAISKR